MATRTELYTKYGKTAEAAQLFETALGTVVLAVKGHSKGWFDGESAKEARKALDKVNGSTLGGVLNQCKKELTFEGDESIYNQFERGLNARNRLFHGFFEKHSFGIQTEDGRDAMVSDLESLHDDLFRSWRLAECISAQFFSSEDSSTFGTDGA